MINVKIKQIEGGILPVYTRTSDACCDCCSRIETIVKKGTRETIPLGFAIEMENNVEAQIRPRSGLTSKGIDVPLGTCEGSYRGEYKCTVVNKSDDDFIIHKGDRICQISFKPVYRVDFHVVKELNDTDRGINGFGSSGVSLSSSDVLGHIELN